MLPAAASVSFLRPSSHPAQSEAPSTGVTSSQESFLKLKSDLCLGPMVQLTSHCTYWDPLPVA